MSLHYLLDGYNIINQLNLAEGRLSDRRKNFIFFLEKRRFQGSRRNRLTVVFDGQENVFSPPRDSSLGIVFTRRESADDWIKRYVEKTARPSDCVVVTDDREIRFYVKALGAKILKVKEFLSRGEKKGPEERREEKPLAGNKAREITDELSRLWLKKTRGGR